MESRLALRGGTAVREEPFTRWPMSDQREVDRINAVLARGQWSLSGPEEQEFESKFAQFCLANHAQCVANGSVALELALRALQIKPGDEVIVPALTWTATAWAVVQTGAVPVFADVNRDDWCLDPADVRRHLSDATRAVIPVHLYDHIAPMDAILEIAKEYSLSVVEDCAHAHGGQLRDRGVGTMGDIGTFSFQEEKLMTSGEGGAVITQDSHLADRLYALKDCGRPRRDEGEFGFGSNYRITEFQAAILNAQLERLPEQLALKANHMDYLRTLLADVPGIEMLPPDEAQTRRGAYMAALRFNADKFCGIERNLILEAIEAEGIPVNLPYDPVYASELWRPGGEFLPLEDPARALDLEASCPVAEEISGKSGFTLPHPLFLGLKADVEDIVEVFAKVQKYAEELTTGGVKKTVGGRLRRFIRRFSGSR